MYFAESLLKNSSMIQAGFAYLSSRGLRAVAVVQVHMSVMHSESRECEHLLLLVCKVCARHAG